MLTGKQTVFSPRGSIALTTTSGRRNWAEALLAKVQKLDDMGQVQAVGKLLDRLVKRRGVGSHRPTTNTETGKMYEGDEPMLEGWRKYLGGHFAADEPESADLFDNLGTWGARSRRPRFQYFPRNYTRIPP